jgi:DnaJ-class molecular chaperone
MNSPDKELIKITCKKCFGAGFILNLGSCITCKGKGKIEVEKERYERHIRTLGK